MKNTIFIAIILLSALNAHSQQRPLYIFFDDNITAINPSLPRTEFIFEDYSLFVNATHRSQWLGFDKAPSTFLVQATTWLPDWSNNSYKLLGNTHAGIDIIQDTAQPFSLSGVYGRLGHLVYLSRGRGYRKAKTFIAAGLNIGVIWQRIQPESPSFAALQGSAMSPDAGFGISFNHYVTKEGRDNADNQGFYIGFSIPQTLQFDLNYATDNGNIAVKRIRHYNYVLGGQFGANNENFKVRPMLLLMHTPTAPPYISGNVELTLQKYLMIGFGTDFNLGMSSTFGFSTRLGVNIPMDGPKNSNGDAIRLAFGYSRMMTMPNAGNTLEFTMTYMVDFQEY